MPDHNFGRKARKALTRLARIALAAWVNVRPDQLPAAQEWINHPSDHNRQAWERVVAALYAAFQEGSEP